MPTERELTRDEREASARHGRILRAIAGFFGATASANPVGNTIVSAGFRSAAEDKEREASTGRGTRYTEEDDEKFDRWLSSRLD